MTTAPAALDGVLLGHHFFEMARRRAHSAGALAASLRAAAPESTLPAYGIALLTLAMLAALLFPH